MGLVVFHLTSIMQLRQTICSRFRSPLRRTFVHACSASPMVRDTLQIVNDFGVLYNALGNSYRYLRK